MSYGPVTAAAVLALTCIGSTSAVTDRLDQWTRHRAGRRYGRFTGVIRRRYERDARLPVVQAGVKAIEAEIVARNDAGAWDLVPIEYTERCVNALEEMHASIRTQNVEAVDAASSALITLLAEHPMPPAG